MCNNLHPNFKPIDESGYAWKIFRKRKSKFIPLVFSILIKEYEKDNSDWIVWKRSKSSEDGFCAFKDKEEENKLLSDLLESDTSILYKNAVIKKIEYKKGLGLNEREEFIVFNKIYSSIIIGEFRIIEEEIDGQNSNS